MQIMSIALKIEQEQFIQKKLKSGKYSSADEVIFEAFRLLEERDQHYEQWLQDLQNQQQDPAFILKQSGFIGCADGDPNLSTNYKRTLKIILNKKHDHR